MYNIFLNKIKKVKFIVISVKTDTRYGDVNGHHVREVFSVDKNDKNIFLFKKSAGNISYNFSDKIKENFDYGGEFIINNVTIKKDNDKYIVDGDIDFFEVEN